MKADAVVERTSAGVDVAVADGTVGDRAFAEKSEEILSGTTSRRRAESETSLTFSSSQYATTSSWLSQYSNLSR